MPDRFDWDIKSSYTYQSLMKAKDIIQENINQAGKAVQQNHSQNRSSQQNNSSYQTRGYQANQRPNPQNRQTYQTQGVPPKQTVNQGQTPPPPYTPPYQTAGRQQQRPPIQTPPPPQQYQVYQPVKTKKQKKREKAARQAPPGMMEIREPSVVPYYAVGLVWLFCGLFAPIYDLIGLAIAAFFSICAFFIAKVICKGRRKYVPIPQKEEKAATGDHETDALISEGRKYITEMRKADIAIENETISEDIRRMEEITQKIFDYIAKNPKKAPQIRKFMNYYLPTTLKLLSSYDQMEETGIEGDNISETMLNIERMLGTIVMAFEKQLDNLFQDDALDISTDITVLEGMLAQEGLTDSQFKKEEPGQKEEGTEKG